MFSNIREVVATSIKIDVLFTSELNGKVSSVKANYNLQLLHSITLYQLLNIANEFQRSLLWV